MTHAQVAFGGKCQRCKSANGAHTHNDNDTHRSTISSYECRPGRTELVECIKRLQCVDKFNSIELRGIALLVLWNGES